jgi:taurine transport system substrate-binding protein
MRRLPLPDSFFEAGLEHYGFHGLSYAWLVEALTRRLGACPRCLLAFHLGNGASATAILDGRSVATSMGFSTLDGLMMGTRPGTLDPGVLLHLLAQGHDHASLANLLYRRAGLLGVSGFSSDMRALEASSHPASARAIEMFAARAAMVGGGLVTAMGGLDAIAFTGGIGEHSAPIRAAIAQAFSYLGARLDAIANAAHEPMIAAPGSPVGIVIVPANEELVIALATQALVPAREERGNPDRGGLTVGRARWPHAARPRSTKGRATMSLQERWKAIVAAGLAFSLGAGAAFAQARKEVTFAHPGHGGSVRVVIDTQELEKSTGYKINWRKFGGGGDVIRAMASGDVQIGEVGSSPAAAAASQGLDVQVFWILDDIADAEQLVAREGSNVNTIADLKGKKVATPFVSTAHYQLLFALQDAGVNPREVQILNMRPPEIAAAWERGDIDATLIWDPALARAKKNGKVLTSAGALAKKGRPTFDAIMVNRPWAEQNKDFMVALVKAIAAKDAEYKANKAKWTTDSASASRSQKSRAPICPTCRPALGAYGFLSLEEQASPTWLGGGKDSGAAKALADTAAFLKEQGRVTDVPADFGKFVTDAYVRRRWASSWLSSPASRRRGKGTQDRACGRWVPFSSLCSAGDDSA